MIAILSMALFVALSLPSVDATEVSAPRALAPGSPLVCFIYPDREPDSIEVALVHPDGGALTMTAAFLLPGETDRPTWIALLAISNQLQPGDYRLQIAVRYRSERVELSREIGVLEGSFGEEEIVLGEVSSRLRSTASPQKEAERRSLSELLVRFDASAIYHLDSLVPPVHDARETAYFGDRRVYRYVDGTSARGVHHGLDLAAPVGSPIYAAGAGRVAFAGPRIVSGNTIVLEHLPGVYGLYYHLDTISVSEGEIVASGQQIGAVGATGVVTGAHLHWEVRIAGVAVDPRLLLDDTLLAQ